MLVLTLTNAKLALPLLNMGWECHAGMGSFSPTSLTGGKTLVDLSERGYDSYPDCDNSAAVSSTVTVSGFSMDPGISWLVSVTCDRITFKGKSVDYSYSSGNATWVWRGGFGHLSKVSGVTVSCSISHS